MGIPGPGSELGATRCVGGATGRRGWRSSDVVAESGCGGGGLPGESAAVAAMLGAIGGGALEVAGFELVYVTTPRSGLPSMTVDGVLRKNGSTSRSWEADLMQAAYLLELLCRYRLEAEMSRAKLYVNITRSSPPGIGHEPTTCVDSFRRRKPQSSTSTASAKHFGIELSRCVPCQRSSGNPAARTGFLRLVDRSYSGWVPVGW